MLEKKISIYDINWKLISSEAQYEIGIDINWLCMWFSFVIKVAVIYTLIHWSLSYEYSRQELIWLLLLSWITGFFSDKTDSFSRCGFTGTTHPCKMFTSTAFYCQIIVLLFCYGSLSNDDIHVSFNKWLLSQPAVLFYWK